MLAKFIGSPVVFGRRFNLRSPLIVHKSHSSALLFLVLARSDRSAGAVIDFVTLRGDGIMVTQTESASALIYWDDKRYGWHQQAD